VYTLSLSNKLILLQFTFEIVASALFSALKPGKVMDALKREMYTYTDGLYTAPISITGSKFQAAKKVTSHSLRRNSTNTESANSIYSERCLPN
jgi:hypothetical protein